jgi:hypothetical protein
MAHDSARQKFLSGFSFKLNQPASAEQLANFERKIGLVLPAALRECYSSADGGQATHDQSELRILSLAQAEEYEDVPGFFDSYFGYMPITENNDSNPVCVCLKSPLAEHVVLVSHDGSPRLLSRSLDGFFQSTTSQLGRLREGGYFDTHDLPSDFDGPERNERDKAIAHQLIAAAACGDSDVGVQRTDALRFACDLLADDDLEHMATLLDVGDSYVREHVLSRLKRISSTDAQRLLAESAETLDDFVRRCSKILHVANIKATTLEKHGRQSIRIEPLEFRQDPIWLNIEFMFDERKRPDFGAFLLERVRFLLANR